jgi:hypothetical protein
MAPGAVTFTEEEIQQLFGHEAAENEDPARLKQYYFKSRIYDKVVADLSLRILVGHKGIGKSALFQIAVQEDAEEKGLPVEVRPDDVADIAAASGPFLAQIRDWKQGIREIIAVKAVASIGGDGSTAKEMVSGSTLRILDVLAKVLKPTLEGHVDVTPLQAAATRSVQAQRPITVYLDDLDRGWQGGRADISRISALLNALRDLSREDPGFRFRVALRSDVYFLVRTADESTDKIEGSVTWYTWTNHEILVLLVKRIETFFGRPHSDAELLNMNQPQLATLLDSVIERRFSGRGKWANAPTYRVLMSLIRRRPRDLVKLLTLAARRTHDRGGSRISTEDLQSVFTEYSQGRIQDTINEYRSELPAIERLLFAMKPNKLERRARLGYVFTTAKLHEKLNNAIQGGAFLAAGGRQLNGRDLASFLYKINFLTARKDHDDGLIERQYFEENRYLSGGSVDFGYEWEIHPAYRWALQPDSVDDIFEQLKLSRDD